MYVSKIVIANNLYAILLELIGNVNELDTAGAVRMTQLVLEALLGYGEKCERNMTLVASDGKNVSWEKMIAKRHT